jgi:hypothetical protein
MRFWSLAWFLPLCFGSLASLAACGDKSAVSLTVTLQEPTVSATNHTLGTELGGGFVLELNLGPEASGPATVTAGNFALQTASGSTLIEPLHADPSGSSFPLVVAKGSSQKMTFVISSDELLDAPTRDALCAGPVVIVGSVMDSLSGGTDSVRSNPITPSCS